MCGRTDRLQTSTPRGSLFSGGCSARPRATFSKKRSTLSMIRLLAIAAVATAYGRTRGAGEPPSSRLVPRGGGRLMSTKPKPLHKEAAIDLSIMGAAQLFFRRTHCTNAGTCELARAVVACRAFFVTVQSYLLAIYVRQLGVARSMKQSAVVKEDLFWMRVRLTRAAVKAVFLLAVHLHFGLMPPLVVSCVTAVVALPYWWDRESPYLGRNQISRRPPLNRRRNPLRHRRVVSSMSAQVPTSPSTAAATASSSGPPSPSA